MQEMYLLSTASKPALETASHPRNGYRGFFPWKKSSHGMKLTIFI
jgi:hypothetical protein